MPARFLSGSSARASGPPSVLSAGRHASSPKALLSTASVAGATAGVLASATILVSGNALRSVLYLGVASAAVVVLLAPHAALYVFTMALIGQWPGQLIKFAGAFVAFSVLLWALAGKRRLVPSDRLFAILCALAAVVLLRALFDVDETALRIALSYVSFVALYWMLSTMTNAPAVVHRLVGAMLLSGFVVALIGLAQYRLKFIWPQSEGALLSELRWAGIDAVQANTVGGVFRIDSITGAADYLAMSMQILVPFAVFWAASQKTLRLRGTGAALVIVLTVVMVLTLSRSILVSTVLIIIPFLTVRFGIRRSGPFLLAGALALSATFVAWEPLRERVASIASEALQGGTNTAGGWRREVLPAAVGVFLDHFLVGGGVGQHKTLLRQALPADLAGFTLIEDHQQPLHNGYLLLGIEVGIAGLALLVSLMILAWWRVRALRTYFAEKGQRSLVGIASATEIAWVVTAFNMLLFPMVDATFKYFWLLLALVGALSRLRADDVARSRPAAERT